MNSQTTATEPKPEPFAGFEHPTANFIYTPNQFLDVCLPNNSRGVVRLVAYVLRRTLGWLDKDGEPIEQDISVPFGELVDEAGISRGAISNAIAEAVRGGFICCTRPGRKSAAGHTAQSAQYRLRWDLAPDYANTLSSFAGFYAGEGHRTPIPNSFFDRVVTTEPLSVTKVVGTVLRHTVGYQNQFGRRTQAPLSYDYIQDFANLRDRPTLARAIQVATRTGYIVRVEDGCFDQRSGHRKPASYAIRWLGQDQSSNTGSKTQPEAVERFKNPTRTGSESQPAERSKNPTSRKTKLKDTDKQQDEAPAVAAFSGAVQLLCDAGFDEGTAKALSEATTASEVEQQIQWLPLRNASNNRLGLLRRAIEGNWAKPSTGERATIAKRQEHNDSEETTKQDRLRQRDALRSEWNALGENERSDLYTRAIDAATSEFIRSRLRKRRGTGQQPPVEVLQLLDSQSKAPIGEPSYDPVYRDIFAAIKNLSEKGTAIDFVTVSDGLQDNERVQQLGGSVFLSGLAQPSDGSARAPRSPDLSAARPT